MLDWLPIHVLQTLMVWHCKDGLAMSGWFSIIRMVSHYQDGLALSGWFGIIRMVANLPETETLLTTASEVASIPSIFRNSQGIIHILAISRIRKEQ